MLAGGGHSCIRTVIRPLIMKDFFFSMRTGLPLCSVSENACAWRERSRSMGSGFVYNCRYRSKSTDACFHHRGLRISVAQPHPSLAKSLYCIVLHLAQKLISGQEVRVADCEHER